MVNIAYCLLHFLYFLYESIWFLVKNTCAEHVKYMLGKLGKCFASKIFRQVGSFGHGLLCIE